MKLTRLEMKIIINFNESEAMASVYTHNGRIRRRLEQLECDRPGERAQTILLTKKYLGG